MNNNHSLAFIAAALAGITLNPIAAQAQTVSVAYNAYELQTIGGRAAVLTRMERMVRSACEQGRTPVDRLGARACTKALNGQIVAKIDNPMVTAMWRGGKGTEVALLNR